MFVDIVSFDDPVPPAVRFTVVVLNVPVGPGAEIVTVRDTGPVKLLRLITVTVVVADEPARNETLVGFAEIEKSGPTRT